MSPNPEHLLLSAQRYACHSTCPLTLPTGLINNLSGGHSGGNDVTASPQANHSPALSGTTYAKHRDPDAALNVDERAQIPEALGIRMFWFGAAALAVMWQNCD